MNRRRLAKFPWDIAVFLTITIFGFVISVAKIINPEGRGILFASERSINSDMERPAFSKKNSNVLDLGCLKEGLKLDKKYVTQSFVRVKGKICNLSKLEIRSFEGLRVKNISNGYEGTIFYKGIGSDFVSDHIALQDGKNSIEIEWKDPRSSTIKKILTDVYDSSHY